MSTTAKAIFELEPKAQFIIDGGMIKWLSSGINQPIQAEIDKKVAEIEAQEQKDVKIQEINTACGNEIENGFISNALGSDYIYQSEQTDQLNLIGVVTAGTDDYFKCSADNGITWNYELHTIAQLKQVLQDGKAHKQMLLQKANDLKVQIENATTLDELNLIVW